MQVKPTEEILSFLLPVATEQEIEIVEVAFKQGKEPSLTVFIDKKGGVDLDACEKFHRAIDPLLDELDPTFGAPYTLNVSSPGLDRPLKTDRDFERHLGEKMEIKLFAPIQGKKYLEATLKGYDANVLYFENPERKIERSKIAKINVAITFDDEE